MNIAICGAGVAGPTLAYWLHRAGHTPVLIEKAPAFRTGGYIIDFWGVGYTVAERMGILPEVRSRGYLVGEVRMVNARNQKVGGFSTNVFQRYTHGRFTSLPRGDLAATIYRTIEGQVEAIFDDSISSLEERTNDILVSFERGRSRDFDLVIGADGLHSTVRRLAFGPEVQFEKELGYRVAAFKIDGYRPRDELVYVTYTMPGRQVSRFSLRDDKTMFLFMFACEHAPGPEPTTLAERKQVLHSVFDDAGWETPEILRAMDLTEDIYFDRVSQIRMKNWSTGRVMLLGDAAACVSLLAGEGTGLAMAEAYVLAGELNRSNGDYREAFANHERLLRPFIESKQASALKFASAFIPRTRWGVWFRNQVTRLLNFRPLSYYFVGRDLFDDFDLPDYDMTSLSR